MFAAMVERVAEYATRMHLIVRRDNGYARDLYERLGFEEAPWRVYEPAVDEAYMVASVEVLQRNLREGGNGSAGVEWEVEYAHGDARLRKEDTRWVQQMYDDEHGGRDEDGRRWEADHVREAEHVLIWHGQQTGALSGERDNTGTEAEGRARQRTSEETEAEHAGTAGGTVGRDGRMEDEDTGAQGRNDVDGSARANTERCAGPPEEGADTRHAARAAEVQQDQAAGSAATQATSGGAAARDSQHGPGDRPHSRERHSGAVDGTGTRQREAWEMYGVQPTEVVDVLIEWAMRGDGQQKDSEQAARAAGMPEQRMERMGDDGTLVSDRLGDGTTNGDERSGTEQQQSAAGTSSNESATTHHDATTPNLRKRHETKTRRKPLRVGDRFRVPADRHECAVAYVVAVADDATRWMGHAQGKQYHIRVYTLPHGTDMSHVPVRDDGDCHIVEVRPGAVAKPASAPRKRAAIDDVQAHRTTKRRKPPDRHDTHSPPPPAHPPP